MENTLTRIKRAGDCMPFECVSEPAFSDTNAPCGTKIILDLGSFVRKATNVRIR